MPHNSVLAHMYSHFWYSDFWHDPIHLIAPCLPGTSPTSSIYLLIIYSSVALSRSICSSCPHYMCPFPNLVHYTSIGLASLLPISSFVTLLCMVSLHLDLNSSASSLLLPVIRAGIRTPPWTVSLTSFDKFSLATTAFSPPMTGFLAFTLPLTYLFIYHDLLTRKRQWIK